MIRVIVADDNHLVRKGICALLEKAQDIEVVGEAEDGRQAIELVEHLLPDVLLIDISMPFLNGIQVIEKLHILRIATHAVILSIHSDGILVRQALRSGAQGYLLKRSLVEELLLAIRVACKGEIYLSPTISKDLVTGYLSNKETDEAISPLEGLSPREREVLKLIAEGRTNNEIAAVLNTSTKTIDKHRTNLMIKLGIHNVAGLVRIAIKYGLEFVDE